MIQKTASKEWFINKFEGTDIEDSISKIDFERLEMIIDEPSSIKSYSQIKAFHALLREFVNSGYSSYGYEYLRDSYKRKAGLVTFEKMLMSDEMKEIQTSIYKSLPNSELKQELGDMINSGRKVYRSMADATKNEMSVMITALLNDVFASGLSSKRVDSMVNRLRR